MADDQILSDETIDFSNMEEQAGTQMPDQIANTLPKHLTIIGLTKRPVFPGMPIPIAINGQETIQAVKKAMEQENGFIGLSLVEKTASENGQPEPAFESAGEDGINEEELHDTGTAYQVFRMIPTGPDSVQLIGQGISRFYRKRALFVKPYLRWEVAYLNQPREKPDTEMKAYMMALSNEIKELLKLNPLFKEQVNMVVAQLNYDEPGHTMDIISNLLSSEAEKLQELLEMTDLEERAKNLLRLIKEELQVARVQARISKQIEETVNKQQKEFFLREQLKAIKKELGMEKDEQQTEIEKVERKLKGKNLSEEAKKVVEEELNKLKILNAQSPEFHVTRNYLDLISDLPWGDTSRDTMDIRKARKILDKDHYGLEDVKDAILEFLSSIIRKGKVGGSVICLVGPPGVGKTSIGRSVADSLGRKFFRFSVGGMNDEAEIKGHRRTYIGAMPGKLLQAIKRAGTDNPVIMIDEIDKIGQSYKGDPASALLEVLDPEQNHTFIDHYLDIPYDLSNILFITTANQLDTIPGPLRDRMEVIRLSGYILEEKVQIARRYLVPKQLEEQGFSAEDIRFSDKALRLIIDKYAREAGVRSLEKQIRKIIRKVGVRIAEKKRVKRTVDEKMVSQFLGKPIFQTEQLYDSPMPGVVLGLAYTAFGGATLYVEASATRVKNPGFKQTGQLGNVMTESAEIAYSYIRSLLSKEKGAENFFQEHFLHLHVPAGATPKDGPSAGITMALALYSLAKNKAVKEGLAMTGELTLTGKVLPIGGVKEKTIAAKRVGIHELIFPEQNKRDFEELPDHVREGLTVHFVKNFEEVLKIGFGKGD